MQTSPNQPPGGAAPAFELESYDDTTLASNARLNTAAELVGHQVIAVVEHPCGPHAGHAQLVIVTETFCWMVIEAKTSFSNDDDTYIAVRRAEGWVVPATTLADYLSADEQLSAGLIPEAVFDALKAKEESETAQANAAEARRLRALADKLEGGVA